MGSVGKRVALAGLDREMVTVADALTGGDGVIAETSGATGDEVALSMVGSVLARSADGPDADVVAVGEIATVLSPPPQPAVEKSSQTQMMPQLTCRRLPPTTIGCALNLKSLTFPMAI